MAGKRRVVATKDYDALIKASEEKIQRLSNDIKDEKANLKKLKKDKVRYDEQQEEFEKKKQMDEIMNMISESDKSFDEIKAIISGSSKK